MSSPILYMGDTSLDTAACYLAGVLKAFEVDFDYVNSSQRCTDSLLNREYRAIILSDYPAANFSSFQLEVLEKKNAAGTGLIMIGGWESFVGQSGQYHTTVLRDILPVMMQDNDDRVNCWGPCVVNKTTEHPITDALPLKTDLPLVGGFNRVRARPDAVTVLSISRFSVAQTDETFTFIPQGVDPLLVTGKHGMGRTVAFMSDAAPHWTGGLVDWGTKRITAQAEGACEVEVGEHYAALFANMIRWAANMEF